MILNKSDSVVEVLAPAKLNLFLEVLARREDGYHEIETLMVPVTIFDTFRFSVTSGNQLRLTCRWSHGQQSRSDSRLKHSKPLATKPDDDNHTSLGDLPNGVNNIVLRAVELLRQRAQVDTGAKMHLIKRIPSAAGLGGASSDAAAALVAANVAWKLDWPLARLEKLSAELGSDIPFFFRGGAAVCRGRGERIEPIKRFPRLHAVVVKPPVGLSTPRVYEACRVPSQPRDSGELLDAARSGHKARLAGAAFNRLQEPARKLSPWIDKLASDFNRFDCLGHQMSGSGSSYFGICRSARHARRVASRLSAVGYASVFSASSFSALPLRR
jgi:4-diphosphocytidyl-2-C-methyl-D-erythritol kinase